MARALHLLTDELNATPAHLPGDRRPLTYQVTAACGLNNHPVTT
ncbi:MAG: hypothetical protein ACR2FV_01095 [Ornithinimicrobium sp.]